MIHPDAKCFLTLKNANYIPKRQLPIAELRAGVNPGIKLLSKPKQDVHRVINQTIGHIPVRFYIPNNDAALPIILYAHGGGWITADIDTTDGVCRRLCNITQAIIISIDYRLAPEHPYPAGLDDYMQVLQWTIANAISFNGNPKHITLSGDSAGASLSAWLAIAAREQNISLHGQVLLFPALNFKTLTESHYRLWDVYPTRQDLEYIYESFFRAPTDEATPEISLCQRYDLTDLCKTLIVSANYDPLCDDAESYEQNLKRCHVPVKHCRYDGLTHVFHWFDAIFNDADKPLQDIADFIHSV